MIFGSLCVAQKFSLGLFDDCLINDCYEKESFGQLLSQVDEEEFVEREVVK